MAEARTIWCNVEMPEEVQRELTTGIGQHRLLLSSKRTGNLAAASVDPLLAEADIAFGQPDPKQVIELARLKWIHLSSAGYARYDLPEVRDALKQRKAAVTTSSSVFNEPCAEHLLAFMLMQARNIAETFANQTGPRAWPIDPFRSRCRLLVGQRVLLLGYGAIARRLVQLLRPLRMDIRAVRQHPARGDEGIIVHPVAQLNELLPHADHVVNVLPASASTNRIIDATRFAVMKAGAVFYNIGRGTTVDQEALLDALRSGRLAAAYLDVTDPEPLPPEHPLWQAPNCHITPHIGGGHINEFARVMRHFLQNLRRFDAALPLIDRII